MEYFVICLVSLLVSALTLFSGFGLGTLLLPAFSLFFPIEIAVAATAVVHLANNLFKVALVGKMADLRTTLLFAIPAMIFATLGAWLLFKISSVKVVMGILIIAFSLWDLIPGFSKLTVPPKFIPIGGALSGFFGGLSGMQGALRSLFLVRANLTKEQFIGTGVVCAVLIDLSRLAVYTGNLKNQISTIRAFGLEGLIIAGTISAFIGTFAGTKLINKVTLKTVHTCVGVLLIIVGLALTTGWL